MKQDEYNWKPYLTRPFNLLGTSVWHEWYISPEVKKFLDIVPKNDLNIEHPKGVVHQYREEKELHAIFTLSADLVAAHQNIYLEYLKKGIELNEQAVQVLQDKPFRDLSKAVEFFITVSHYCTIAPYYAGLAFEKKNISNSEMSACIVELRHVSYFPRIMREIIEPLAREELKKSGFTDKNILDVITFREIKAKEFGSIHDRLKQRKLGKTFVYKNIEGKETVEWANNPEVLINNIEGNIESVIEIKGIIACKGKVQGKVKIVLTNDISDVQFDRGDILVAISTSPELLPLIKKAGAIVTNEGGITSHAAIISRELNIPCIIGTKIATKVLKNGDHIEVDADSGIVKILNI